MFGKCNIDILRLHNFWYQLHIQYHLVLHEHVLKVLEASKVTACGLQGQYQCKDNEESVY